MASYYVNYNGVNLTNLIGVRSVETTDLPPRENNAITIWERSGSIYDGYRYGEREITVTFLVRATAAEYRSNPNVMDGKLWQLRSVFRVDEPKPLYLGTTEKYILAVPEGDYTVTELRYDCCECTIHFVCHTPEYYSTNVSSSKTNTGSTYGMRSATSNNTINVYNKGDASTYPIINVGINNPASFIQIENITNGNKFLIGSYPKPGKQIVSPVTIRMNDSMGMSSLNGPNWSPELATFYIDENRDCTNGQIRLTNDYSGFMIREISPSYAMWRGAGRCRPIEDDNNEITLTNFEVRATLHFNSSGTNGDPTVPQYKEDAIDPDNIEYRYKVIAPSVPIKDTTNIFGSTIGSYDKGEVVSAIPKESGDYFKNGFIQTNDGWCEAIHFKRYILDRSTTDTAMNVVANTDIDLMSQPSNDPRVSKLLATIEQSTVLRVETGLVNGYYKLYIPYNGKVGYVDASKVDDSSKIEGAEILYPEEDIIVTDDSKTGICEIYGIGAKGAKLFKLCLVDDNMYYSLTKPSVEIGGKTVLEDITAVSGSNKAINNDSTDLGYDYLLEGNSGNWNEFYGELGIRRKNNKWEAWIYKMEHGIATKKLVFKQQDVYGASDEDLRYIIFYMGTQDQTNMCGMAVTHIRVDELASDDELDGNITMFEQGDDIKIDCCNNVVYLNNKLFNEIDMDSQFIELVTGNNVLKVTSDDLFAFTSVLFNEKYL